jgi:hypothetical protein
MDERLSSTTVRGNAVTLTIGIAAAIVWVGLVVADFHHWDFWRWLTSAMWLVLIALNSYQTIFYQEVTLTQSTLKCVPLFGQPASYRLTNFVAMHQTKLPGRPLRICFKDGKSFLFSPKLKESSFSLRYTPAADFIAYWTEEITDRSAVVIPS